MGRSPASARSCPLPAAVQGEKPAWSRTVTARARPSCFPQIGRSAPEWPERRACGKGLSPAGPGWGDRFFDRLAERAEIIGAFRPPDRILYSHRAVSFSTSTGRRPRTISAPRWRDWERESCTARLEAVVACRAAVQEKTRERVPLQWAGTEFNLGRARKRARNLSGGPGPRTIWVTRSQPLRRESALRISTRPLSISMPRAAIHPRGRFDWAIRQMHPGHRARETLAKALRHQTRRPPPS